MKKETFREVIFMRRRFNSRGFGRPVSRGRGRGRRRRFRYRRDPVLKFRRGGISL